MKSTAVKERAAQVVETFLLTSMLLLIVSRYRVPQAQAEM